MMRQDEHMGMLSELELRWAGHQPKSEIQNDLQSYWSFRDEIEVIDTLGRKGSTTR